MMVLFISYKQQLHHANNEISELTNQLQETIASRDSETRQLKTALANTESAMQTLQQELHTSTAQMAAQVTEQIKGKMVMATRYYCSLVICVTTFTAAKTVLCNYKYL